MRILFIPNAGAVIPHLVPLMALDSRLVPSVHESAFLIPSRFHAALKKLGKQVLNVDYRPETAFRDEMSACGNFQPDAIIDDFSMVTLLTSSVAGVPRITIARTGAFPGAIPRNRNHRHSCESDGYFNFDVNFRDCEPFCGVPAPRTFADVCAANASIIPGIPSIETLPPSVSNRRDFFFAGSLKVPDHMIPSQEGHARNDQVMAIEFIASHLGRDIAYVTIGSVLVADTSIRTAILHMLDIGIAVISTVQVTGLSAVQSEIFYYAPFLQMDAVCSRVSVMVHHCGSGTYQYAINHKLPSICLGSQFYDRDDVAHRLDELGVAKYIPASADTAEFMEEFREALNVCRDSSGEWYRGAMLMLDSLKRENDNASKNFDLETVLYGAIEACE